MQLPDWAKSCVHEDCVLWPKNSIEALVCNILVHQGRLQSVDVSTVSAPEGGTLPREHVVRKRMGEEQCARRKPGEGLQVSDAGAQLRHDMPASH